MQTEPILFVTPHQVATAPCSEFAPELEKRLAEREGCKRNKSSSSRRTRSLPLPVLNALNHVVVLEILSVVIQ
jgi:hypothetical protein